MKYRFATLELQADIGSRPRHAGSSGAIQPAISQTMPQEKNREKWHGGFSVGATHCTKRGANPCLLSQGIDM